VFAVVIDGGTYHGPVTSLLWAYPNRGRAPMNPLMLQFAPDVELDEVLESVRIAYERSGCAPCGRLSLYLHAQEVVDPAFEKLRALPHVVNVGELADGVQIRSFAAR
jgi:hypothetical protein